MATSAVLIESVVDQKHLLTKLQSLTEVDPEPEPPR